MTDDNIYSIDDIYGFLAELVKLGSAHPAIKYQQEKFTKKLRELQGIEAVEIEKEWRNNHPQPKLCCDDVSVSSQVQDERSQVCIFCHKHSSQTNPFCPTNPGNGCTYGMRCEFNGVEKSRTEITNRPAKIDARLCLKCGVHKNNPASKASDCSHEYPL